MLHQPVEDTSTHQMLEKRVRAITTTRPEGFGLFDHHSKEGAWERFCDGLLMYGNRMLRILEVASFKNNSGTLVRIPVEQLTDRCTGLTGLSDEWTKTPC